jgi:hypothetical protein
MSTRTWVGGLSLAALTLLGLAMAAGGLDVAPAEGIGGAYGGGLGIEGSDFIQLERLSLLAYAAVVACAAALPARLLWGAVVLLIGAFAIAPPLLSLDVFSYLSYARLDVLHDLNPYTATPGDVPGDEALPYVIDNDGVVSAYGPLFGLAPPCPCSPPPGSPAGSRPPADWIGGPPSRWSRSTRWSWST